MRQSQKFWAENLQVISAYMADLSTRIDQPAVTGECTRVGFRVKPRFVGLRLLKASC